ncbi:glycosyltransferase family 4 protein [Rhodothermus marinus]|uniref:glycosyltransferase family 4 protein n=1 Tax=Rhodothermus marinus TaxID=29549 RepID=UPI0037C97774
MSVIRQKGSLHLAYLITRADELGGAQMHVLDLARGYQARGCQVTILAGSQGSFSELVQAAGISFMQVPFLQRAIHPWKDVRCLLALRRLLQTLKPDLVATHSSKAGWLGRLAAHSLRIPVVFTAHGWAFTEGIPYPQRWLFRIAERLAAPFADKIITVSEYDLKLALRYRIAPPERLITVYYGIPDIPLHLRAHPGADSNGIVRLIMVARFSPQKDQALVLRALAGLRDLPWELELVGDGPLRPACEQLARQLQLSKRVHFLGERKDVAERLARAHIFVLASNYEGLPITILEAMRAGLPVVAANVSGVSEGVEHGKTGLLFARGNVEELRSCLRTLILSPELRQNMGCMGRMKYEMQFTLDNMLENTWNVYSEVIARKGGDV